jgi:hypothetical protein
MPYLRDFYTSERLAKHVARIIVVELSVLDQESDCPDIFAMVWKYMDLHGMCVTRDFAHAAPCPDLPEIEIPDSTP